MSNQVWGGALTAVGALTFLGGVAIHQPCTCAPTTGIDCTFQHVCGQPLVNAATVVGTAATAGGVYLLKRPAGRSRSRGRSHTGGVTSHNRRSRYRGH